MLNHGHGRTMSKGKKVRYLFPVLCLYFPSVVLLISIPVFFILYSLHSIQPTPSFIYIYFPGY